MVKRIAAISFILLANLVLLAHAVIPHHHHEAEVCFVNSHCESDHESDKDHDHHHDHEGSNDYDSCLLKEIVTLPTNQQKPECNYFSYIDQHSTFHGLFAILSEHLLIKDHSADFHLDRPPYIPALYSCIVCSHQGLRAPPLV